jgi:hypothetical protein
LATSKASSSSSSRIWSSNLGQQLLSQGSALWGAVKQKHILLPTVFVFLWQVSGGGTTRVYFKAGLASHTCMHLVLFCAHHADYTTGNGPCGPLQHSACTLYQHCLCCCHLLPACRPHLLLTLPCSTSTQMSSTSPLSSLAGSGWQGPLLALQVGVLEFGPRWTVCLFLGPRWTACLAL